LTLYAGADVDATLAAAQAQLDLLLTGNNRRLGVDVVPSAIVAALRVPGVYDVALLQPSRIVVPNFGWAHCDSVDIRVGGVANG
jgi:phage-related baseplate assembly protein